MSSKNIVVVEDEPDILEVLSYNLNREGYSVATSLDGSEGLKLIQKTRPDLVLLDLMLPGMDGLDICREIKENKETNQILIIMVTAKGEESDLVLGLGIGADDYIVKPFSPRELIARVKAVLRRGEVKIDLNHQEDLITIGDLTIDTVRHQVLLKGDEVKLTATEFRLLKYLASNQGRVFSREQLMDQILANDVVVVDRNIDVHIRSIRKKLGCLEEMIETIRGVGYRFKDLK